ncbi:MAG: hypothetical protein KBT03_09610 [Bacteroidales bacterium]|nr:hypothetical protein [Candidatus Scybalousia scybalohippi]
MPTDTDVDLIINELTKAQYDTSTKDPNQLYMVTDDDHYATSEQLNELDASKQDVIDSSHKLSADLVSDGTTNKVVTQTEKTTWNNKQAAITGGATTITSSNLTANRALVSNGSGKVAVSDVTSTELGYLDGVTSAIQTQLNGKATSAQGEKADSALQSSDIVNNLTSTATDKTLSANMGKSLNDALNNEALMREIMDNDLYNLYLQLNSSKQDNLVSGTNIKTINSTTILGSGNIDVATTEQGAKADTALQPNDNVSELTNDAGYQNATQVNTAITSYHDTSKQDTLVSGTNIKTINGNSVLGSGNLSISELPDQTGQKGKFLTTNGTTASWDNALNYNNISNCITHIPQDIKLELNNGTLKLKAGSKVYVPNGPSVFDVVNITSDKSLNGFGTGTRKMIICYRSNEDVIDSDATSFSGPSTPSGSGYFYNTTSNKIDYVLNGSLLNRTYSFPIAIVSFVDSTITSIDQVFNGFGYIGSTVFALPGVKVLIPDGRNSDGSFKNIEKIVENVSIQNAQYTNGLDFAINNNGVLAANTFNNLQGYYVVNNLSEKPAISGTYSWCYCVNDNKFYSNNGTSNWIEYKASYCGKAFCDNNLIITSFTSKTTFHALDYNDKGTIAGFGMPSDRYIDLTLGAGSTTYTAPANGYVALRFGSNSSSGLHFVHIFEYNTNRGNTLLTTNPSLTSLYISLPIKKGNTFVVSYGQITSEAFRFYYAEGEQ